MDLKLYLNDVEYRFTNRYIIREQVGQPATSSLDVKIEAGGEIPKTHTKVEIKESGTVIFFGFILTVETPTFSSMYENFVCPIQVIAAETIFTRRLVSDVWTDKFTHEIVQDIFDDYLLEEGLTLGTIETFDRYYEDYIVPNLRLSDVLQELADGIGAVYYITPEKVFNFISKSNFPNVTPPTKLTELKLAETGQDLKTVQKISGAKAETSIKTLAFTWAAEQDSILLGYQISGIPAITVNSVAVDVGVQGIDDPNTDVVFLYREGNNSIVLNDAATNPPTTGDSIAVIYRGFFDVEINTENEALKESISLISGTSGKIESIVIDTSIRSTVDGQATADNLLTEKGIREQTVTLTCLDVVSSKLLNSWTLNYPDMGIAGDYVIVERTMSDLYDKFRVSLKLKNRGFYSRYGTAFNKNAKEINNLSIRTDNIIFKSSSVSESILWSETWTVDRDFMVFTPGTTDIFSPAFFDGLTPSGE